MPPFRGEDAPLLEREDAPLLAWEGSLTAKMINYHCSMVPQGTRALHVTELTCGRGGRGTTYKPGGWGEGGGPHLPPGKSGEDHIYLQNTVIYAKSGVFPLPKVVYSPPPHTRKDGFPHPPPMNGSRKGGRE